MRKRIFSLITALVMMATFMPPLPAGAYGSTDKVGEYKTISAGSGHSMAIKEDGSLWTWGGNSYGQLGDGTSSPKWDYCESSPMKILDNVVYVSAGSWHSTAIKEDGTLWAWGSNSEGQLGDSTKTDRTRPAKILENVISVSASLYYTAAITENGDLWIWGDNRDGYLGDGTRLSRTTPIKIMSDVASVSCGSVHNAAVKKDGSLWVWGHNDYGELGDGTFVNKNIPVKIMDNVIEVSCGNDTTAIIKKDGTLWTCGSNEQGELGDGTFVNKNIPVKIMDNVASVVADMWCMFAIKKDGTLWSWGDNSDGRLGDGTTLDQNVPVEVMEDTAEVSVGPFHTLALEKDGTLWSWGGNSTGQLGDGTTVSSKYPVNVLKNVRLPSEQAAPVETPLPSHAPTEYPYTIDSLKLVSAGGAEYDEIPTDTGFIVNMDVSKTGERSGRDCFIVAARDENGALVSMNYIKADLPTGTNFSCGVNIQKPNTPIAKIEAFVWDALDTMTPLSETLEYKK